jgi:phage terminase large subunit GpA-like protein
MKILVAGWDSGGGVEAVQTVVRRAVRRGHQVRVLGPKGFGAGLSRPARTSAATGTLRTTTPGSVRRTCSKSGKFVPPSGCSSGSGTG